MENYPLIAEHGLIGDLQTAALVTTDGTLDWMCLPRFDSPSLFGSLLDKDSGGEFRISPASGDYTSKQLYIPDTAVLITRFLTEAGVGEITDFMVPLPGRPATRNHQLVRMVRCVRGTMDFDVLIQPRPGYGQTAFETRLTEHGVVFDDGDLPITMHVVREPGDERLIRPTPTPDGDITLSMSLQANEVRGIVLESDASGPPREIRQAEFQQMFNDTVGFWRDWLSQSTYTGRWREAVLRSAVALKLMTYAPSGALVAAPTAGLPEQLGGERNWDYRYTWVRDASFSVYALLGLGFTTEAAEFCSWLGDRFSGGGASGRPLDIMYRVDGSSDLVEDELKHWDGYRGSRPVRIGNGAATQVQMDIFGEAMDSIYFASRHGIDVGHQGWMAIKDMVDWLSDNWDQPGEGIWESRGGKHHFTYGRVMSWVAFDRAIRMAASHGRPGSIERWSQARDAVYAQVMDKGWSESRGAFIQHYGSDVLDSSNLRMATVGFIAPTDPLWTSTLDAMERDLVTDSLVYRYDPAASPDGLTGDEGTFSLCTFNYVDALARAGRLDEARLTFEKMLTYANHLGLYSEEIALTGEQLGNFPQAFTHLALIDAAITLDAALNRGAAHHSKMAKTPPRQRVSHEATRGTGTSETAPVHVTRATTG
jgi:GH15 family glucan-1,4-alpha-glucosidase